MCTFPLNYLRKIKICRRTRAKFSTYFSRNFSKLCLHPLSSRRKICLRKGKNDTHMTNLSITERHTHTNHFHLSYSHILCAHILYICTIHCWKEARRTDGTRARKILRARTMYLYFSFVDNPDIIHYLVIEKL